jgi:hypothetical protein
MYVISRLEALETDPPQYDALSRYTTHPWQPGALKGTSMREAHHEGLLPCEQVPVQFDSINHFSY